MTQTLAPVHPGEILLHEFMQPLAITQYRLAKETNVSPRRINEIVLGKRAITADTAIRLARFFGTSEMFWLNLQSRYDLDRQRHKPNRSATPIRVAASASRGAASRASRNVVLASKRSAVRSGYRKKAK